MDALRRSFSQISARKPNSAVEARFTASSESPEQTLEINGATLLHNFKVTYVVYDALREYNLIYEERDDGYFLVDAQAANLVVSFLAQRMSHRLAIRTLTGVDASFLLSTACDVYDGVIPDRNALFASAVLRLHIPAVFGRKWDQPAFPLTAAHPHHARLACDPLLIGASPCAKIVEGRLLALHSWRLKDC